MNLFGRKKNPKNIIITATVCGICGMEFVTTLRMLKHMKKAHTKTKKDHGSTCPNC
tara:strand:- start:913 stop:1080 length:168 start_codon:yes stop_codon:yes gene_type:complete